MIEDTYPFKQTKPSSYRFTSIGRKQITKEVVFSYTVYPGIVNMGFGDVLPDGSIDDKSTSNNGDIIKILGTIVHILIDYTDKYPGLKIFFAGNTPQRSKLYFRIVRNYYYEFNKTFTINILEPEGDDLIERPFEPEQTLIFLGFLIKRID